MVEGGGSSDFRLIKTMLYARPDLLHRMLEVNALAVAAYLNAQIEAGAQAVMLFDTWGGALADGAYQTFSLAYMRKVLARLKRDHAGERVPSIVFTKGGGLWLDEIADSGCDAVGLDWTVNLGQRAQTNRWPLRIARQPRSDGSVCGSNEIKAAAGAVLTSFGPPRNADGEWHGHVFNLGHGISQFTPPESVEILVDAVHTRSRELRR